MKLWSDGWANGEAIPERYAAGRLTESGVDFADNLSPPLAWSELPVGTRSLVLLCQDFDVPDVADDVNQTAVVSQQVSGATASPRAASPARRPMARARG